MDDQDPATPQRVATTIAHDVPTPGDGHAATVPDVRPAGARDSVPELAGMARYRPGKRIGHGGMGEVVSATDLQIGREVAIKRMHEHSDPRLTARFLREAKVQGRLDHPSIVPVYELGHDAGGAPFFAMKKLSGISLRDVLADPAGKGHTRHKLLAAVANVALAIDFAHARGVVHRDLKPENVMLGHYGEVYVLDWGIAKLADEVDDSAVMAHAETLQTQVGAVVGTPRYMAPEQQDPDAKVGPAADVFALGGLLFEVLARETLQKSVLWNPDVHVAERLAAKNVEPELIAICERATREEPAERPRTAREVHDAIEAFLAGDRDLELRRNAARRHAAAARDFARGHDTTAAMREVGRALVLHPEDDDAFRTFAELLSEIPKEVPVEVERELVATLEDEEDASARRGQLGSIALFAVLGIAFVVGIRSYVPFALQAALVVGAAVLSFTPIPRHLRRILVLGSLLAAESVISGMYGPLIVTPTLVVGVGVMFTYHAPRSQRPILAVLVLAAVFVPLGLQLAGVVPASYVVSDGSITIIPNLIDLPYPDALIALVGITAGTIVVPLVMIGLLANKLRDIKRQLIMQRYRLRQLVPRVD